MPTAAIASSISPLSQGFLLCASLIIALGPQNLFILRQGLRRQHLFATALFSTLADVILISLGVGGLSALISDSSSIQMVITFGGILFMLWCGGRSFMRAFRPAADSLPTSPRADTAGIIATIAATLSFSFLNPAAYFDTIVFIGSKSLNFPVDQRLIFGIGAILASTMWFFTLAYGASKLSVIFRSRIAWRTLDFISGWIMLGTAATMFTALHLAL